MPQSALEDIDQQTENRNLDTSYRTGGDLASLLLGGQVMGGLTGPLRAAGALNTVPRQFATGAGLGVGFETAHGRGPLVPDPAEASDAVRQLQQQLKDAGYYRGPIDGNMGPATQDAKARFDAAEMARADAANKSATSAAALKEAEAKAAEAAARIKENERLTAEGNRKAAEREAGSQRLREIDDSLLSRFLKGSISAGPYVGAGLGYVAGHKMQSALGRRAGAAASTRAATADSVMGEPIPADDIPGRVGRLNRFWSEGNRARVEPFRADPQSTGPHPYTPNAGNVPPASELYRPSMTGRAVEGVPIPALGGIEHVATEFGLAGPARQELTAASEAVNADPSEANVQRLQIARGRAAVGEGLSRLGYGMAAGSLGHTIGHSVGGSPRARPSSLTQAEAERGRLNTILGRQRQGGPTLDERRNDPNFRMERNAPTAPGEVETWVSPAGQKSIRRDGHGYRGDDGKFRTAPPRGWRRIASADDASEPASGGMAAFLQNFG
jgi:hypothetical protein